MRGKPTNLLDLLAGKIDLGANLYSGSGCTLMKLVMMQRIVLESLLIRTQGHIV